MPSKNGNQRSRNGKTLPPEPEPQQDTRQPGLGLTEEWYLGEYSSREELEADIQTFWDATTSSRYGWCPRHAQYAALGVEPKGEALQLDAGNAVHAGMHAYYTSGDGDLALEVLRHTFGENRPLPHPAVKYGHINAGFLEVVFKNYLVWASKHDSFKSVLVHIDDLDLSNVVAARWQVLPDGRIVLGESKLIMAFDVDGQRFIYCGKPDLPLILGGALYIMDHKTSCGGYLSTWWAEKHEISNQLRGYCRMVEMLLGKRLTALGQDRVQGAIINGVYAGEKAVDKAFRGSRFSRFGPYLYRPAHLDEAIANQWWWWNMRNLYSEFASESPSAKKYGWGQNTGKACQGCPFLKLCKESPVGRRALLMQEYTHTKRSFLDL